MDEVLNRRTPTVEKGLTNLSFEEKTHDYNFQRKTR